VVAHRAWPVGAAPPQVASNLAIPNAPQLSQSTQAVPNLVQAALAIPNPTSSPIPAPGSLQAAVEISSSAPLSTPEQASSTPSLHDGHRSDAVKPAGLSEAAKKTLARDLLRSLGFSKARAPDNPAFPAYLAKKRKERDMVDVDELHPDAILEKRPRRELATPNQLDPAPPHPSSPAEPASLPPTSPSASSTAGLVTDHSRSSPMDGVINIISAYEQLQATNVLPKRKKKRPDVQASVNDQPDVVSTVVQSPPVERSSDAEVVDVDLVAAALARPEDLGTPPPASVTESRETNSPLGNPPTPLFLPSSSPEEPTIVASQVVARGPNMAERGRRLQIMECVLVPEAPAWVRDWLKHDDQQKVKFQHKMTPSLQSYEACVISSNFLADGAVVGDGGHVELKLAG
jgi:hypothetical protein